MSNPTIPQREYEELFTELFGDLPDLNAFDYDETNEKTSIQQQQQQQPHPEGYDAKQKTITTSEAPIESTFQPSQISTPISENRRQPIASSQPQLSPIVTNLNTNVHNPIALSTTCVTYPVNPITYSPLSVSSILPGIIRLPCTPSATPITIPLPQLNPYHSAVQKDGIVQLSEFQHVVITIPTIDILKSQHNIQMEHSQMETMPIQLSATHSVSEKPSFQSFGKTKRRNYDFLKNQKPITYVSVDLMFFFHLADI